VVKWSAWPTVGGAVASAFRNQRTEEAKARSGLGGTYEPEERLHACFEQRG
jgi:hypothetical protein